MKEADVFQVGDEAQLYVVEAIAPSGSIYARRFDLQGGPYGEPLAFQENAGLKVLFNDLQPEQEEGWEYCDINHVTESRGDPWTGYEWFAAEIAGAEGKSSIATSDSLYFIRGEPILTIDHDKSRAVHQKFVNKLLGQGWQIVPGRRRNWYHLRLKREPGAQFSPAKPERPGCLTSLFGRGLKP